MEFIGSRVFLRMTFVFPSILKFQKSHQVHSEMKQTKNIQHKFKPREVLISVDKDRYSRLYQ